MFTKKNSSSSSKESNSSSDHRNPPRRSKFYLTRSFRSKKVSTTDAPDGVNVSETHSVERPDIKSEQPSQTEVDCTNTMPEIPPSKTPPSTPVDDPSAQNDCHSILALKIKARTPEGTSLETVPNAVTTPLHEMPPPLPASCPPVQRSDSKLFPRVDGLSVSSERPISAETPSSSEPRATATGPPLLPPKSRTSSSTSIHHTSQEQGSSLTSQDNSEQKFPWKEQTKLKLVGQNKSVSFSRPAEEVPRPPTPRRRSGARFRSIYSPGFSSSETCSVDNLDASSDDYDDDYASEIVPRGRKSSLPTSSNTIHFLRASNDKVRSSCIEQRTPMTKQSNFTVKYVRVHGPEDGAYKNDSKPRGLIFMKNFERFDDRKYKTRLGSATDYENLLELFQQMGYRKSQKCCETGHITKRKFLKDLSIFSKLDHKMYDSCIIILMSHGVRDKTFVCSDGEHVDLMDVYSMLNNTNCHHLCSKPKIFILQFCRPQTPEHKTQVLSPRHRTSFSGYYQTEQDFIEFRIKHAVETMANKLREEFRILLDEHVGGARAITCKDKEIQNEVPVIGEIFPASPDQSTPSMLTPFPRVRSSIELSSPYPTSAASSNNSLVFTFDQKHLMTDAAKLDAGDQDAPTPDYSDMYSIFSTNSGGVAYRHPRKGSLLVQAICHVFSNHSFQDDIEELVRKVSKWMQQEIAKDDPTASNRHTVVERVNNGLDKEFYFNPTILKAAKRNTTICC